MTESQSSPHGHPADGNQLLAELYEELRKLARARMAKIPPGQTLQPTALVHEAYIRLASGADNRWNGRGHFFGAAAQSMRQILVDQARRKSARRHGGGLNRLDVDEIEIAVETPVEDVLALDRALDKLRRHDARKAELVLLRFFAGLEREEIADLLNVSVRTVDRDWRYVAAWLHRELAVDLPTREKDAS